MLTDPGTAVRHVGALSAPSRRGISGSKAVKEIVLPKRDECTKADIEHVDKEEGIQLDAAAERHLQSLDNMLTLKKHMLRCMALYIEAMRSSHCCHHGEHEI